MKPFIPIYPGIFDYVLRGEISRSELGLYVMMHGQADYSTGIWTGSAPRIAASAPRGADLRTIQREMKHLADVGLIKHFHRHGARGNFPWLINKYICRSGALRGKQLNATLSTSLRDLRYEACAESDAESVAVSAPYQEVRVKREEKKTLPAPSAQGVSLAGLLSERILQNNPSAKITDGQVTAWAKEADLMMGRDGRSGAEIRSLIEWSQADPFWRTNILSMAKLRKQFDQLTLKKHQPKGGSNGKKLTGDALTDANLKAAGFIQ